MAYENAPAVDANKGVRTQHADYNKRLPQWIRCRDVIAGSDAVKEKGKDYLPMLSMQEPNDYKAYVKRANFYNATARTVGGLVGMIFRKPPQKETPTGIDNYLQNIDMCGSPFDVFAQDVVEECFEVGRLGILIDHLPAPTLEDGKTITKGMAEQLNLRPTMKIYNTESIINWRFKTIKGVWTLCQVVLAEDYSEPTIDTRTGKPSEFDNTVEKRWRVLDLEGDILYRVRVFRIDDKGDDELVSTEYPLMNAAPLDFIPFYVITPEGVSFEVEEPPLIDLVDLNLSHYRTSADYEHGCHFTALPTLFVSGYQPSVPDGGEAAPIYLGSQAAIVMPDKDAKASFVEFTGNGLSTIEKNLDRKEQQMAILGARMIAGEKKAAETATTTAIHRTGENAVLSAVSIAVSLGLSKALTVFAKWAGFEQECKYELNRDFLPLVIDGPTLTAVTATWQAGGMSDEEYFDFLQRGDVIEAEVSFEEHKAGDFQDPIAKAAKLAAAAPDKGLNNPPNKDNKQ